MHHLESDSWLWHSMLGCWYMLLWIDGGHILNEITTISRSLICHSDGIKKNSSNFFLFQMSYFILWYVMTFDFSDMLSWKQMDYFS